MRRQFGHLLALCTPHMHSPILTSRQYVVRIGCKRTLYHRRLIQKRCEFMQLSSLKCIQKNYTVVSRRQHQQLPIIAEFHTFHLIVIFPPIGKRSSLAVADSVETYPDSLLVFLLDGPGHTKSHPCRIEIGDRIIRHTFVFHIQLEFAFCIPTYLP